MLPVVTSILAGTVVGMALNVFVFFYIVYLLLWL